VLRLDVSLLRESRDFRSLWLSGIITGLGSFATYVAVPYHVAEITGSYVAVGIIGIAEIIPLIIFGLYGGVIADRHDRRKVNIITELAMLVVVGALFVNALSDRPHLSVIYVAVILFAAIDGIQRPSLDAMLPRIVPPERLAAAGVLRSLRGNIAHVLGPALGGLLIAIGGVRTAFAFDIASFAASAALLSRIRKLPPTRESTDKAHLEIFEAFRYLRTRRDIIGTYLADTAAMVFAFPFALFPFIARDYDAEWALGFLYTAVAIGSLVATATSGWTKHVTRHGRAVLFAAFTWGIAIAASGLVHNIWWVIAFLVLAGAADMVSGLFRSLIWDLTIPDEMRGRMAGLELLSYSIGPQAGQVRSTLTARYTSLQTSLVAGGVLCAGTTAGFTAALRSLWNFDSAGSTARIALPDT